MPLNHSRAVGIIRYETQVGSADASKYAVSGYDVWRRLVESSTPIESPRTRRRVESAPANSKRRLPNSSAKSERRRGDCDFASTVSVVRADLGSLTRDLDDEYRDMLVQLAAGDFSDA